MIGVTGSTGKTSTKDILTAMLRPERRVVATPANRNTEIGLPLVILDAPAGTEVLVLEMAMRGRGQIAELAAIAEPDIGLIVNVGPVHLELLGTLDAIAATKAELIAGPPAGPPRSCPPAPRCWPHLRRTCTPSPSARAATSSLGDVQVRSWRPHAPPTPPALAAARAAGVSPHGRVRWS